MQNELRGRTFSAPRKSMRGKGRVTIQFGCCYNYAVDREGRQPGEIPLSSSLESPLCRRLSGRGLTSRKLLSSMQYDPQ